MNSGICQKVLSLRRMMGDILCESSRQKRVQKKQIIKIRQLHKFK